MPRATSNPRGRVEDVQWWSRRGKEGGEHPSTFPSRYNEDYQCQGLYSPALVFRGTGCSPNSGPWGQCITFPSLWVFSFAEVSCKALKFPYFLWDFGVTHDPRASCSLNFSLHVFITDGDVMFSVSKRLHPCYDGSRDNSFLAFGLIYQLNNKSLPQAASWRQVAD